jgi:phosphatidate phosphatase PAH1
LNRTYYIMNYLRSIKQENFRMPDGPLLCNPNRLKFVLIKKMWNDRRDNFKKPFLENVRSLFPHHVTPFSAAFGATSRVTFSVIFPNICRISLHISQLELIPSVVSESREAEMCLLLPLMKKLEGK